MNKYEFLLELIDLLTILLWLSVWVAGCVLAKGFWSTFFAVCTGGLWSLYLVAEKLLHTFGFLTN